MRLINADKLIELFSPFVSEDKKVVYQPRQLKIDDIKNAPTVEAIPVEWIRGYVSIWVSEPYKNFVLNMIKNWEKENE